MRRRLFFALSVVALAAVLPGVVTDVIDTSFYIIDEDTPADEDAYVLADSGSVESVLDGDLMIAVYEDLTISGTVTGDVVVASGGSVVVTESGVVEGSVRGVARRVVIGGRVGDDLAVAALSTEVTGSVGRDIIGAGGSIDVSGEVGRNLQGWFFSGRVDATVGNDVDIRVGALDVGGATTVTGDLLYRADRDATVDPGADVGGTVARLSTRAPFVVRVSLALFTIFGIVAFALLGLLVLWLSQRAAPRAAGAVATRMGRSAWVGLAAVIGVPVVGLLVAAALQPFLAKLAMIVLLLIVAVVAVLFGPIPALAAFGDRITGGRAGLYGGFVVGVVVWRAVVWLVPIVGLLVSLVFLILGVGGWLVTWWSRRRTHTQIPHQLRSDVAVAADDRSAANEDDEWEPPLPPLPGRRPATGEATGPGLDSNASVEGGPDRS